MQDNRITLENARPGTTDWHLNNPATKREIEGYALLTSVNLGGEIGFCVSTSEPSFTLEIFRTGWYNGAGARLHFAVRNVPGALQPTPVPDPSTGLADCQWMTSYLLTVPLTWVGGIFLARLTASATGKQTYIHFVVREDGRSCDLVFVSSVTTYQAYNFWPDPQIGRSLYLWPTGHRGWKVSFNRPYVLGYSFVAGTAELAASGLGAGEYLTNLQPGPQQGYPISAAGFEYNMVRWLEKNGYDAVYLTPVDLHANGDQLQSRYKALISAGHNEYWSMQMRTAVMDAFKGGLNLGIFGSNTLYYQVRLEADAQGFPNRTMVCYKEDAESHDPLYHVRPQEATVKLRDAPVNAPEAALLGLQYFGDPFVGDIVISNASHWLMKGTGLKNGDRLRGLLGYEVDTAVPGVSPANIEILAQSPVGHVQRLDLPPVTGVASKMDRCIYVLARKLRLDSRKAHMAWYEGERAAVFAAGTMQWSWGLDNYGAPAGRAELLSSAAEQITHNVLARFIASPKT